MMKIQKNIKFSKAISVESSNYFTHKIAKASDSTTM